MARKRFDPTLKQLAETYSSDWVHLLTEQLALPASRQVQVIDSDVSTISAAVDKVYRVGGRSPWILHLEAQASHNARLARQLLLWNVLLDDRHDLPVYTVLLLLRREADRASLDGTFRRSWPSGGEYLSFQYRILRLWQLPAETLLEGGLGTLPLAPVTNVSRERLPSIIKRMQERIQQEASPAERANLWSSTLILLGLQYSAAFAEELLRGVQEMEESTTYQAILARGEQREARKLLLKFASQHLGAPDAPTLEELEAIAQLDRLEAMIEGIGDVSSWAELLAVKPSRPRRRRGSAS